MNESRPDVNAWVAAIAGYLRDHPHSADSAEGIARWWLNAPPAEWPKVRRALKAMVDDGRLECHTAADGREHFRLRTATDGGPGL